MPRIARIIFPDLAVHVTQRGNNRGPCFFRDADYRSYLEYLQCFAERFHCLVHAYCLMTNHVHLLLTPARADACALLMKYLGQCYVQDVNKAIGRTGTLWEGRFRSCLVHTAQYVLACYRYIELNPVRAGMVAHPRDYRWSSYRHNAEGRTDAGVAPHPAYLALADDPEHRFSEYRGLLDEPLPQEKVDELRRATRSGCVAGAKRQNRGRPSKKIGTDPIFRNRG